VLPDDKEREGFPVQRQQLPIADRQSRTHHPAKHHRHDDAQECQQ
jgi:hypothetical protein